MAQVDGERGARRCAVATLEVACAMAGVEESICRTPAAQRHRHRPLARAASTGIFRPRPRPVARARRLPARVAVSRLVARWDRFWFASQPTSTLALFRIVFGLLVIVWALALLPDLLTFFGRGGIVPRPPDYDQAGLPWTWGLLNGAPGDAVV